MRRIAIMFLLPALIAGASLRAPAQADDDRDERETVTQARKRGDILGLATILEIVRDRTGGNVIGIEFEQEGDSSVYEIYYLDPDGRRRALLVNAHDGSLYDHHEGE